MAAVGKQDYESSGKKTKKGKKKKEENSINNGVIRLKLHLSPSFSVSVLWGTGSELSKCTIYTPGQIRNTNHE